MENAIAEKLNIDNDRYHLRDIETKEVKLMFRVVEAAFLYQKGMRWSLGGYYEVYDSNTKKVMINTRLSYVCKRSKIKARKSKVVKLEW